MDRFSLEEILDNDPLKLLSELKVKNPIITSDDRLIAKFKEINDFYEKNNCEPKKTTDINERGLFSQLNGLRKSPEKMSILKKYDKFNLLNLNETIEASSIDDIFNNDPLGLLSSNEDDIFILKNVPMIEKDRADPDFIARREKFEEFEKYEPMFIQCQKDLKDGKRKMVPSVESHLTVGVFCVLDGVLLYILDIEKGYIGNSGKINRRTTLIFENGTKSHMLLRSLGKRLKKSGNMIIELDNNRTDNLFNLDKDDKQNGYIYILKSLSNEDVIATKKNLFKIGFSTTAVETRTKNAVNDPTYLMADVQTVAAYEVYNVNPHKLEQLIHRFFSNSCLDIDIFDEKGNVHKPREWFIVPLEVIEEAIELIISGEVVRYSYHSSEELIKLI